ncbi:hypothetical protein UG54_09965 [Gordonia sihwensis]|nr:hypothetical protein UG54_09965 [Gordonia sihwensis]
MGPVSRISDIEPPFIPGPAGVAPAAAAAIAVSGTACGTGGGGGGGAGASGRGAADCGVTEWGAASGGTHTSECTGSAPSREC